jgi:hypothetical protein
MFREIRSDNDGIGGRRWNLKRSLSKVRSNAEKFASLINERFRVDADVLKELQKVRQMNRRFGKKKRRRFE